MTLIILRCFKEEGPPLRAALPLSNRGPANGPWRVVSRGLDLGKGKDPAHGCRWTRRL